MSSMPALTLWQPWASLIALEVKSIETRSWPAPAKLIGERIAVHAAARVPTPAQGPMFVGDFHVAQGGTWLHGRNIDMRMPFGAVVATARLVACVPMVADYDEVADVYEGPAALELGEAHDGTGWAMLYPEWGGALDEDEMVNVSDQLPYGDFRPGRWAWLLEDLEQLAEPAPASGRQKVWRWRS